MNSQNNISAHLVSPPRNQINEFPVKTSNLILPFHKLSWDDFERFCFQLGSRSMECLDTSYIYGRLGQKQDGIDIYFREEDKKNVWQIKRYETFKSSDIANAVHTFAAGKWFGKVDKFTLCVSNYLDDIHIVDEIDRQTDFLAEHNIIFSVLNSEKLTIKAQKYPDLIESFFGQCWVEALAMDANVIHNCSAHRKRTPLLKSDDTTLSLDTKPVSSHTLLISKLKELFIPAGLIIFNLLLKPLNYQLTDLPLVSLILLVVTIINWVIIPVMTFFILREIMSILSLNKVGRMYYSYSKLSIVLSCIDFFQLPRDSKPLRPRIDRVIKNEDGKVFEILGCTCPHCQSKPIGYMYPKKLGTCTIRFVCNQNPMHSFLLDPKSKISQD